MATILVVDDSDSLRAQVCEILAQADLGLHTVEARNGVEALPLALSGNVDIVLSDVVMPELDGIGLLRALRLHRTLEELPVVLVTSQQEQETRSLGFEVGANDYLTRPFAPQELVIRVQVQLRLLRLQGELERAIDRFQRLSTRDDLTGLANRRHFVDECRRELSRCRRHKLALTVCVLDVDRLRQVNERAGHQVGDALIAEVAATIGHELRQADTLARFVGGKFALLLPHADGAQGQVACQRIGAAIAARTFEAYPAARLSVTVGMSCYPSDGIETADELMNAAERNLDRAKLAGAGQVVGPQGAGSAPG